MRTYYGALYLEVEVRKILVSDKISVGTIGHPIEYVYGNGCDLTT
jgi:hypothetical protein